MKRNCLFVLLCFFSSSIEGVAREAYAVYQEAEVEEWQTEFSNTLTFYYDDNKDQWWPGYVYSLNEGDTPPGWYNNSELGIDEVYFDASFADARPTSTAYWFAAQEYSNLKNIYGLQYLNTSEVTDMSNMFYNCYNLKSLDLSHFDTSKVTDMSCMFYNCKTLTSLDLSHFDTDNVINMAGMFSRCNALTGLDVSHFKTAKVSDMNRMFWDCNSMTSLDISHFNTGNVTNMALMFYGCEKMVNLDLSGFNTSNVTDMRYMFYACNSIERIYVGDEWSTEKVNKDEWMFMNCYHLVGGMGTEYNEKQVGKSYAHIDGGPNNPGYFTSLIKGDVNGDGTINAFDIVEVVIFIKGTPSERFNEMLADTNDDGTVNVADIMKIVNFIIEKNR